MANDRATPRLSAATIRYLKDLVNTGLYGSTLDGVARELIEQGIRRAIADQHITSRHANPKDADST